MPSLAVSLALVVTVAVVVSDGHKYRNVHNKKNEIHKHLSGAEFKEAPVIRDSEKGSSNPANQNSDKQAPVPIVRVHNDHLGFTGILPSLQSILWKCSHLQLGSPAARMTRLKPIQIPDGLKPTELLIKRCEGSPKGQRLVGGLVIACNMRGNTPPKIIATGFHVRVVGQGPGGQRIESYQFCEEDSSP